MLRSGTGETSLQLHWADQPVGLVRLMGELEDSVVMEMFGILNVFLVELNDFKNKQEKGSYHVAQADLELLILLHAAILDSSRCSRCWFVWW